MDEDPTHLARGGLGSGPGLVEPIAEPAGDAARHVVGDVVDDLDPLDPVDLEPGVGGRGSGQGGQTPVRPPLEGPVAELERFGGSRYRPTEPTKSPLATS